MSVWAQVYYYKREQIFHTQHILQQLSTLYSLAETSIILYFNYLFYISSTWQSLQQMQVYSPRRNIITVSSHVKSCRLQPHKPSSFVLGCHLVAGCLIMLIFRSKRRDHQSDAGSPSLMVTFFRSCTSQIPKADYYIDNHIIMSFVFYIYSQNFPNVDFLIMQAVIIFILCKKKRHSIIS